MHSGHTTSVNKHNPLSETRCTNPNKGKTTSAPNTVNVMFQGSFVLKVLSYQGSMFPGAYAFTAISSQDPKFPRS